MSRSTEIKEKHASFFSHLFFIDFTHIQLVFFFLNLLTPSQIMQPSVSVLGRCRSVLQQGMLPAYREGP